MSIQSAEFALTVAQLRNLKDQPSLREIDRAHLIREAYTELFKVSPKIFMVDDEPDAVSPARDVLKSLGYTVSTETQSVLADRFVETVFGNERLSASVRSIIPSVIFLDWHMSKIDGYDIYEKFKDGVKKLKQNGVDFPLPMVVLYTADLVENVRERFGVTPVSIKTPGIELYRLEQADGEEGEMLLVRKPLHPFAIPEFINRIHLNMIAAELSRKGVSQEEIEAILV